MGGSPLSLLLDTHVLVWLAEGSNQLPKASQRSLESAARKGGLAVSAISFWEVAMLCQRGRISLAKPVAAWREQVLGTAPIREIPITGDIGIESVTLPGSLHGDPADRIIIATARLCTLRLATRDRQLHAYGSDGHVEVLAV